MRFSDEEIVIARRLHQVGLPWEPQAGHYVYDETGFCKQTSPFQERVYFILNYDYFMKAVGGVERFKQIMFWLPTWHDARRLLEQQGVTDAEVADRLQRKDAIARGAERYELYQLIEAIFLLQTPSPEEVATD